MSRLNALEVDVQMMSRLWMRRLEPWRGNTAKRQVTSPRICVRDSGLVHALLALGDEEAILGHPVAGGSWERFVIECLIEAAPQGSLTNFHRTAPGAEIDLLITLPGGDMWIYAIKHSLSPKVTRGFHHACQDLRPQRQMVIYPGSETYPLSPDIMAMSLETARQMLRARA